MKKIFIISTVLSIIILAGCQNLTDQPLNSVNTNKNSNLPSHGEPYSKGPAVPPTVKGPSAPPPQAQAVTKNENIRLTLPLKST